MTDEAVILEHYSAKPLGHLHEGQQSDRADFKPKGLWVSVPGDDDWPSWCRSNEFGDLTLRTRFTLVPDANVLWLRTVDEIDTFHDEFASKSGPSYLHGFIYWRAVADRYAGVIIAPYQWSRRLHGEAHRWYYSWDCASGCIWRPRRALVRAE